MSWVWFKDLDLYLNLNRGNFCRKFASANCCSRHCLIFFVKLFLKCFSANLELYQSCSRTVVPVFQIFVSFNIVKLLVLIWGCTKAVFGYLFWNNVSIILELFQTVSQRQTDVNQLNNNSDRKKNCFSLAL